jgi:hypothetical protein
MDLYFPLYLPKSALSSSDLLLFRKLFRPALGAGRGVGCGGVVWGRRGARGEGAGAVGDGAKRVLPAVRWAAPAGGEVVAVRNSGSRVRPRDKGGSPGAVVFSGDFDSGDSLQWASRQCLAGRLTLGSAAPTPFEGGYRARFEVRAGDVEPLTGNNRCELTNQAEPSVFQEGEDVFYRFQVRLDSPWPWEGRWNAIWQLHQQSNSGSPPVVLEAYGSSAAKSRFKLLQAAVCCPIGKWGQGRPRSTRTPGTTSSCMSSTAPIRRSASPSCG